MMSIVVERSVLFLMTIVVASAVPIYPLQLSERDQHLASQHFKRGMEALVSERYDAAETEFKAAVAIDRLYDAAFYGLGQTYMATKRYPDALKAYLASRDAFQAATAAEALAGSEADRRLRDQIEALKDNERNLTRLATGVGAQTIIDQIRAQIQQLESRKGRRAGATPPPIPAGLSMAIGSAHFRLNDIPNAEKEYKAALEVNPNFGEAHNNLAVVYLITGRAAEADTEVKAAEKAGFQVNPKLKKDIAGAKK
jgi:tetratricopeptide (TPR) repeat protein